ncbi:MAG: hypothetical protein ABL894_00295 [Hyphomicrobium sp.]
MNMTIQHWSFRVRLLLTLAAMVFCAFPALAQRAGGDTAIKRIIPHNRPGKETCFEGSFGDKAVDMQQWPTYAEQIRPTIDAGGKPLAAATMQDRPNQSISHVALYLNYTNGRRARNESWDFSFTVGVTSPSLGKELFARSGCAWSGWDYEKEKEIAPEFMLACWVECDGGGMRAVRIPGTASINLFFDRLKMQAGCEGGGIYGIGTSEAKVAFRLERAPLGVCKALKAWDRD